MAAPGTKHLCPPAKAVTPIESNGYHGQMGGMLIRQYSPTDPAAEATFCRVRQPIDRVFQLDSAMGRWRCVRVTMTSGSGGGGKHGR